MNWRIWVIVAVALIVVGCLLLAGVMTRFQWDFSKLGTAKYETNRHDVSEAYEHISVHTETADVILKLAADGNASVVCYEQENAKHTATVKDGTLEIRLVDERKWYENIGINFQSPKITVYLPKTQYGNLSVDSTTGDVEISEELQFESMDISLTTGDIHLQNITTRSLMLSVTTGQITGEGITCLEAAQIGITTGDAHLTDTRCKSFSAEGKTGDVVLKNVIAEENMSVKLSTGDVRFDSCDAGEMTVKTSTGSVTGSLLSPKIFYAQSDTGKVDVPKTTTGGSCEISTSTGSIRITVTGAVK